MAKSFTSQESRELLNRYKNYFKDLEYNSLYNARIGELIINNSNSIIQSGTLDSAVMKDITNKEKININDSISFLLNLLYKYSKSIELSSLSKMQSDDYYTEYERNYDLLNKNKNVIKWIFLSNKTKNESNDSYNFLLENENGNFITIIKEINNKLNKLDKVNDKNEVESYYLENINNYQNILIKLKKDIFGKELSIKKLNTLTSKYINVKSTLNNIENKIKQLTDDIKKDIDYVRAEQMCEVLRQIPIEELSREKSGLKIKFLRDGGFTTIADTYIASHAQISSAFGISEDTAYTIKNISTKFAEKALKDTKLKLSLDNKTKKTDKAIKDIYAYLLLTDKLSETQNNISGYSHDIDRSLSIILDLGNGLKWIFIDEEEKNDVRLSYNLLNHYLNSDYFKEIENLKKYIEDIENLKKDAWSFFEKIILDFLML